MASSLSSSLIYRLLFLAVLFFRPASAEVLVTGTPAIIILVIILILFIGVRVAACFFCARRKNARKPQIFVPPAPPPAHDQVPMLPVQQQQGQFRDAAAVPGHPYPPQTYPQDQNTYPQNIGGYPQDSNSNHYAQNPVAGYPKNPSGNPQNTGYSAYPPGLPPPVAVNIQNKSVLLNVAQGPCWNASMKNSDPEDKHISSISSHRSGTISILGSHRWEPRPIFGPRGRPAEAFEVPKNLMGMALSRVVPGHPKSPQKNPGMQERDVGLNELVDGKERESYMEGCYRQDCHISPHNAT
ncbi:hypothetical protein C8R43DRAFT_952067 [Mycena crocata]|nr:hypothetical protein C8R43DRAFT_952067 [Mycena crocata]